ncbi:MAG: hypothetical protein DMG29_14170, partial [Acidobacteria bacterium]
PNGTDFWTATVDTGIIFRINIATGELVSSFDAGLESGGELAGLAIFGENVVPCVKLSSKILNFADQPLRTTSPPQTITLTNCGTAVLTITSIVASGDFAQTNTCGSSLAPGASCIITIAFTPKAVGRRDGSITITDNAPDSPQSVPLTGSGILAPVITLSSSSLIFGTRLIGTTSLSQTSILTNSGTAVLNIASIAASGDFAQTNNCGTSLAVGTTGCTISAPPPPRALELAGSPLPATRRAACP